MEMNNKILKLNGCENLLGRPAIGVCGSRDASEEAIKHAKEFGKIAAEVGLVVISGYAKGIDLAAHMGVLEGGGSTVAVLAEGINNFRIKKDIAPLVDENNFLAVSCFEDEDIWTPWRAMQRNDVIVELSRGLVVVEARSKGGTLDAGNKALKYKKPLFVISYSKDTPDTEGNIILISKGGSPVRTRRELRSCMESIRDGALITGMTNKMM